MVDFLSTLLARGQGVQVGIVGSGSCRRCTGPPLAPGLPQRAGPAAGAGGGSRNAAAVGALEERARAPLARGLDVSGDEDVEATTL